MMGELSICVGSRLMLTNNVNVSDGLTNGAMGTVTNILRGTFANNQPDTIYVLFDDMNIGRKNLQHLSAPPSTKDNSTLIQNNPFQVTRHQVFAKINLCDNNIQSSRYDYKDNCSFTEGYIKSWNGLCSL